MNKSGKDTRSKTERWGEFRFSLVGALLSAPAKKGELQRELKRLSANTWTHPISGQQRKFAFSTIERWYYACRLKRFPVKALKTKGRVDRGISRTLSNEAKDFLARQYREHPSWSYKLHADNLLVSLTKQELKAPSYQTVLRYMQNQGMLKQRRRRSRDRQGHLKALNQRNATEVRSFEVEYVGALWHLDFHHGSCQVLSSNSGWRTPICLAVMDDHSRVVCHLQWYLAEGADELVHGFSQALMKYGLPRSLMSDNGAAMTSVEFTSGLKRLGIVHATTLPYSPYQNGKQERLFGMVEGRLMAMLEGVKDLNLEQLNAATCAWVDLEYNRSFHRELGSKPIERFLKGKDVTRPSPNATELKQMFCRRIMRRQRRTDGTVSLKGVRFEIPSQYRNLKEVYLEYAEWDKSFVHLVDQASGSVLSRIYPINKARNASGDRSLVTTPAKTPQSTSNTPPLLAKLLEDYAATGLPPAYIPKPKKGETE